MEVRSCYEGSSIGWNFLQEHIGALEVTVHLTWNPVTVSTGLSVSYNVYRATVSGGPYLLAATDITGTNYTDGPGNLDDSQTYYYRISAFTIDGESLQSAEFTAAPPALPSSPGGITISVT